MDILTTTNGGALMRELAAGWGGLAGIQGDCQLAIEAYRRAKENVRLYAGDPDTAGKRAASERLERCQTAVDKYEAERAAWFAAREKAEQARRVASEVPVVLSNDNVTLGTAA